MIVDSHCHIISGDQRSYPRDLGPNPAGWVRDLPAEEFLNLMSGAGVDRAVLVQAFGAYRYDNRYVAKSAARYPDRFVAVCIIDPMQPDAPEKLDYCVNQQGIRGLRVVTWKKYLPFYLAEFQFRFNNRNETDIFGKAIAGC